MNKFQSFKMIPSLNIFTNHFCEHLPHGNDFNILFWHLEIKTINQFSKL